MKKTLSIILILSIFINFSSCERDDICVDGDTPFLIVGFFDIDDTTNFKVVNSLRVRSIDNNAIVANEFGSFGFSDRSNVTDSIFLPLRIDNSTTTFEFILNSAGDEETGNIDTLSFSYDVGEQFISRGCGFVANYNNLDTIRTPSSEDWIRQIRILEPNIENNPTSIHVQIFH